ncbi:MAG: type III secretion system outer membrane ring subunit SctC [Pseudomonadota bacterium]
MKFQELIEGLGEILKTGPLEPDQEGRFTLVFDERLPVHCFPWGRQEMILSGTVVRVPDNEMQAEDKLTRLLKKNLSNLSNPQEVLSLEKESGEIILYLRIALDGMGLYDFMGILENFVNRLEFWKKFAGEAEPSEKRLMKGKRQVMIVMASVVGLLFFLGTTTLEARPIPWGNQKYSRISYREDLSGLLRDFLASQQIPCVLSSRVNGVVGGEFKDYLPEKFFNQIVKTNGLTWYYDGGILYLYRADELGTAIINLENLSGEELKKRLAGLGVLDERFSWQVSQDGGLVYISGPPRYAELVTKLSDLLDKKEKYHSRYEMVKVFPLKHAWADDVKLTFRDKEITIPGVAAILRNLLSGKSKPGQATGKQEKRLTQVVKKLKGKGLAVVGEEDSGEKAKTEKKEGAADQKADEKESDIPVSGEAQIQSDTRMNAVIVRDIREKMAYYADIISCLDIPVGLVEIQAAIIDINTESLYELGVDWNIKNGDKGGGRLGFNADKDLVPGSDTLVTGKGFNLATTITWGAGEFILSRIRALEQQGNARILSRPSVLTINNLEALIERNETFYVKVPGAYEVDLFNVTAGISLKVTPHIIEGEAGKKIKLMINIEDGNITTATVDNLPVVSRSTINTQAVVRENESLLIGGHSRLEESNTDQSVPFLSKVPVLGALFRSKSITNKKVERMFMITPRIVTPESGPEPGSRKIPESLNEPTPSQESKTGF